MASDKKKAKRVATLFGKQKVTTTPEIAAMIKSGEIDPATHSIKNGKFAPKRKAVVGGMGIIPTAKLGSATAGTIPTAKLGSATAGTIPTAKLGSATAGTIPTVKLGSATAGTLGTSATTVNDIKNKSKPGDDSYTKADGYYKKGSAQDPANNTAKSAAGAVPSADAVAASAVPKTDKATGQPITPAQNLAMQEQKALKIAPFKADVENMTTQLNSIMAELDDDDDGVREMAQKKLEKIKATMSATNE